MSPFFKSILKKILTGTMMIRLSILGGCSVFSDSGPKSVDIKGDAAPILNHDAGGNSLSVVVRVYQLKAAAEFSKLTFDMLASNRSDSELLTHDFLEKDEVVLVPDSHYAGTTRIREDTKYIGVVALFREPDQHYWRYLIEASKVRKEGLAFTLQNCYLTLTNLTPYPIPGQPVNGAPVCGVSSSLAQRNNQQ